MQRADPKSNNQRAGTGVYLQGHIFHSLLLIEIALSLFNHSQCQKLCKYTQIIKLTSQQPPFCVADKLNGVLVVFVKEQFTVLLEYMHCDCGSTTSLSTYMYMQGKCCYHPPQPHLFYMFLSCCYRTDLAIYLPHTNLYITADICCNYVPLPGRSPKA